MFDHDSEIGLLAGEVEFPEDDGRHLLPPNVEELPPGPVLAAYLSTVDPSRLNGHDVVLFVKANARLKSHYEAQMMAGIREVAYSPPGGPGSEADRSEYPEEYASDEIRAALTWTRSRADNEMAFAIRVWERFPQVWDLLATGLIDIPRVRTIVNGVGHVSEKAAQQIIDRIVDHAPRFTTGQLSALIRKLCAEIEPEEVEAAYTNGVAERRITIEQSPDLTGELHTYGLPIQRASAIGRRINGYAYALRNAGDERTIDQLRVDVFLDLLEGVNMNGTRRGMVDIRVDLTTLAGLDEKAGEIPGMGPVIADVARKTALAQEKAEWRFIATDANGDVVTADITRRRPSAAQKRLIHALQETCTFPGCRMPAADCDIDHIDPWAEGGKTTVRNSGPKCRHDHILRDKGWEYLYRDGKHIWTSPLGHTYITGKDPP